MKRYILPLVLLALSSTAKANLIDRGNGMIYDQDLNITWSQNANINGLMTWSQANSWADGLTLGGFSDWRLPTTNDTGTAGCDFAYSGTDCGYNVNTSTSEMAHLFFNELGNKSIFNSSANIQAGNGVVNSGPFSNIQSYAYWSGTEFAPNPNSAWYFNTEGGYQGYDKVSQMYAWAVRPGDVTPVPVPGAVWLLGSGLIGLIGFKRRGNRN